LLKAHKHLSVAAWKKAEFKTQVEVELYQWVILAFFQYKISAISLITAGSAVTDTRE
jgi:hypothetical protein